MQRTVSGDVVMGWLTPAAACCASSSWRCVVDAGWMTSVRVSPMLARWLISCAASMKRIPAA